MADFQARVRSRMDEEAEKGAVFFCGPVETLRRELKLTPKGDLVYIVRAYTGAEDMEETRAYKLTGIDSWKLTDRELTMSGEFMYDHDDHLWGVRDNLSRPVHRKIRVPQPLDNTDALEEFLGSMAGLSGKRASDEGIGSMFVQKEILEPMAGIGLATVASPYGLPRCCCIPRWMGPSTGSRSSRGSTIRGSASWTGTGSATRR